LLSIFAYFCTTMSVIHFTKYQGTGNDFVLIDNISKEQYNLTVDQITHLCDRKFGIGADGLIIVEKSKTSDFFMNYYNADGSQSFCGNGARCAVHFTRAIGLIHKETTFKAIDGEHHAKITDNFISIQMKSVHEILKRNNEYILNTGSPHFVRLSSDLSTDTIVSYGREVRYHEEYKKDGINVNLMSVVANDEISIGTYERGVEDETLSCGTGATACAIVFNELNPKLGNRKVKVNVKGGELIVRYFYSESSYTNIELSGPAIPVFNGTIEI